jgi:hypothetical protein
MFDFSNNRTVAKGCFPSCQSGESLLHNFPRAASGAAIRDALGFHPSVQASNIFETAKNRGEFLCCGMKSISGGAAVKHPKIRGKTRVDRDSVPVAAEISKFAAGFFEGKARSKTIPNQTSMKGRDTRQEQ